MAANNTICVCVCKYFERLRRDTPSDRNLNTLKYKTTDKRVLYVQYVYVLYVPWFVKIKITLDYASVFEASPRAFLFAQCLLHPKLLFSLWFITVFDSSYWSLSRYFKALTWCRRHRVRHSRISSQPEIRKQ